MIAIAVTLIICATVLGYQHQSQSHDEDFITLLRWVKELDKRLVEIERKKPTEFDAAAFEELKSKVEALRINVGIRGMK